MTRQHILAEIKRTADANGGVPLGRERFLSETGIKDTDWYGKYWGSWNDAVREAGYAPNPLQSAFTDDHLLRCYALLTRELGKLPRNVDLRLKRRSDPSFPSHNTYSRFGPKAKLVNRLREFCTSESEYSDVVTIIERYPSVSETQEDKAASYSVTPTGFVYLIKSGRHYKIGKTNALGRRERELTLQLPERTRTIHAIRTDDPEGIEAYWHQRFAGKRGNGEWFELDSADVAAFRRRKFM